MFFGKCNLTNLTIDVMFSGQHFAILAIFSSTSSLVKSPCIVSFSSLFFQLSYTSPFTDLTTFLFAMSMVCVHMFPWNVWLLSTILIGATILQLVITVEDLFFHWLFLFIRDSMQELTVVSPLILISSMLPACPSWYSCGLFYIQQIRMKSF